MIDKIFEQMDLKQIDENLFQGIAEDLGEGRVFGGQVVGQALIAAGRTVQGRPCHSLHVYFLRRGDPKLPILFEVERLRDGRSLASRRVNAVQNGSTILTMTASFQSLEDGFAHQVKMPDVPRPEDLLSSQENYDRVLRECPSVDETILKMVHGEKPVEVRHVESFSYFKPAKMPPNRHIWYRSQRKLGGDLILHQCLLAYASDVSFLGTCLMPHGRAPFGTLALASIDHSMWFHRSFDLNDWILIAMESTVSANSRAFVRGNVFTQDGTLVGSVTQEGLIREIKS